MEKPEDFALGDTSRPYCRHCTDARGELSPYEQVLEANASYYEDPRREARRGDAPRTSHASRYARVARPAITNSQQH